MSATRETLRTADHRPARRRTNATGRSWQTQRYQFFDLLGRGGMGEVYRGRAIGFGGFQKPVAIKRLLPDLASDSRYVDRLVTEAKLLVSLQHSNLVSVLDLGRCGDEVFIVLEYLDGPSLHELLLALRRDGHAGLPPGLVSYIGQAACAGLDFAHDQPAGAVIHADLSPANILLTRAGEVKVADFGVARRQFMPPQRGTIEGKWPYMSPEQALGGALGPASDMFSMGVVLYELATGTRPFSGDDSTAVASAVIRTVVRPPSAIRPELPESFERVCLRALAQAPTDRYPRMRDLGAALRCASFEHGWHDGADELAQLVAECVPPRGPTDATLRNALAVVGIGAGGSGAGSTSVLHGSTELDMVGTVVLRKPSAVQSVTSWSLSHSDPTAHTPVFAAPAARLRWSRLAGIASAATAALAVAWAAASASERRRPPATVAPAAVASPTAAASALPRATFAEGPDSVSARAAPTVPTPIVTPLPNPPKRHSRRRDRTSKRRKRAGTLRVHTEPWAYVSVGRDPTRYETPVELRLPAGTYRLRFANPEADLRLVRRVTVRPGAIKTLSLELTQ